jgi:NADH:ubiquinone oxidoreductase subunit 6 (subunit J)
MEVISALVTTGIYAVMLLSVIAAIGVVTLPNIFHAALALVAVLLGSAAVFAALHADFLAVVQVLIYVGAVMTLVIFAIMLTERLGNQIKSQSNKLVFPAIVGTLVFFIILVRLIVATPWPVKAPERFVDVSVLDLGRALMGPYVFPFEVISVILIAALVGAIVIARKEKS